MRKQGFSNRSRDVRNDETKDICNFGIKFNMEPKTLIKIVKEQINLSGDDKSGVWHVSYGKTNIKGSYSIKGNVLNISVTDKPKFISCKMIKSYLQSKLSQIAK